MEDVILSVEEARRRCKDIKYVSVHETRSTFVAVIRRDEDDKLVVRHFGPLTQSSLTDAINASKNFRDASIAEAERRAERTDDEKREDDLEAYGGNSSLERDFAISLSLIFYGTNINYLILNDATRADVAFKFSNNDGTFLPIQIKTTKTFL